MPTKKIDPLGKQQRSQSVGLGARSTSSVGLSTEERSDRRMAILLAAEKLFANHGYHGVTIRMIALEANVPLALVGYYFGAKQELFCAIFEHWSGTIDARLEALRLAQQQAPTRQLTAIIDAFIKPVLQLRASSEGEYYAQLLARELMHASPEADRVLREYFDPLAHAFIDALEIALPHTHRGQVAQAYQFSLGCLLHHICDTRIERLSNGKFHPNDANSASMLSKFIAGGIKASLPKQ